VRFDRLDPAPFFLDIGTCEEFVLNANGSNDTLNCTGNLAALIHITADGGAGDDTLRGSNGADLLLGGDNNDFIDGQQGNDTVFMGAGDDAFQWDPGDGSDTVEGQAGHDVMLFNGSNGSEIFAFSSNPGAPERLRFTRNLGSIVMDADDIEQFDLNALGSADAVTVNDLAGTDLAQVNIELAGTIVGTTGDSAADSITVNGTASPDTIQVAAVSGAVEVSGLAAFVVITHPEAANDTLTVNGLGGVDTITAGPGVASLIMTSLNQ
jgi:Ca2+-binding RTX toxin-like protein